MASIYHMTLKKFGIGFLCVKMSRFYHLLCNVIMDVITLRFKICKPLVVYRFYCMGLYRFQTRRHMINLIAIGDHSVNIFSIKIQLYQIRQGTIFESALSIPTPFFLTNIFIFLSEGMNSLCMFLKYLNQETKHS